MSKTFVIKLPKVKARNPLGAEQERKQVFKDRRLKRGKDARVKREHLGEYGYVMVELISALIGMVFFMTALVGATSFLNQFW